jgi:hypothetical protein
MPYIGNPIYQSAFEYKDGTLFWKIDRGSNKVKGKPVGSVNGKGYLETKLDGKFIKVHRVVFEMHHGYAPEVIDHIDGNRQNNKIDNLRAATDGENKYNQKIYKSNTSGAKGVMWHEKYKKWRTQINYNGKRKCLGSFDSFDEACEFVALARDMVHGDFARTA